MHEPDGHATGLIVADDLTGAGATAAQFAHRGLRALVLRYPGDVAGALATNDVVVVDAATREESAAVAAERIHRLLTEAPAVDVVSVRTDTTLRGHVAAGLTAALQALRARPETAGRQVRAIVAPSYPATGRITVGGHQIVDGQPLVVGTDGHDVGAAPTGGVAALLDATSLRVGHIDLTSLRGEPEPLRERLADGADVLVCDAATDADLRRLARGARALADEEGIVWLGLDPGPFSYAAFAAVERDPPHGRHATPVLVVAGSMTGTTRRQIDVLERTTGSSMITVDPDRAATSALAAALRRRMHTDPVPRSVGLRTVRTEDTDVRRHHEVARMLAATVAALLGAERVAGMYLTGGDVAGATVTALGADGVQVDGEVGPLTAIGTLVGGPHGGLPVVTKGGLIGPADAAARCVDAIHLAARRRTRDPRSHRARS